MAETPHRVIDAHVHVWSSDTSNFPFSPYDGVPVPAHPYPVETLLADLDDAGVAAAVVIQPRLYGADHRYLDQALQRFPERLTGVYLIDPANRPSRSALRSRFDPSGGYRGLRLVGLGRGPEWPRSTAAVWDLAGELGAVLSLLVEPPQLIAVAALARHYPQVPVVIDHLGYCRRSTPRPDRAALRALAEVDTVQLKVSALGALSDEPAPYPDLADVIGTAAAAFGPDRLLWGSDLPHALTYGTYQHALESAVHRLSTFDGAALTRLLSATAARLYRS